MSPTSLPLCLICIWNQNVQIYGTVSHPKSGPPHRYPASYSSKEKELSFSPTIFFSGSFCTDNELSSPVTTKSFINVPSFLIFTVIAFAQVLTIICLDYCSEELDGLASSLLLSQVFLILLLCIFNKKAIWFHIPKQKKPKVTMSPPHMLFVKGSLLLVRQSSHSLAGHIVTLLSFGLVFFPCALYSSYPKSIAIHKTCHVFYPEIRRVFLCLEYPSEFVSWEFLLLNLFICTTGR